MSYDFQRADKLFVFGRKLPDKAHMKDVELNRHQYKTEDYDFVYCSENTLTDDETYSRDKMCTAPVQNQMRFNQLLVDGADGLGRDTRLIFRDSEQAMFRPPYSTKMSQAVVYDLKKPDYFLVVNSACAGLWTFDKYKTRYEKCDRIMTHIENNSTAFQRNLANGTVEIVYYHENEQGVQYLRRELGLSKADVNTLDTAKFGILLISTNPKNFEGTYVGSKTPHIVDMSTTDIVAKFFK